MVLETPAIALLDVPEPAKSVAFAASRCQVENQNQDARLQPLVNLDLRKARLVLSVSD